MDQYNKNEALGPKFVISLDFELFWGVADSKTVGQYCNNIVGVWQAVPAMLALFRRYDVRVTWATVGMLMCRDYHQWLDFRPSKLPTYERASCSTYLLEKVVLENPRLFFARPLVEQILTTVGHELASHTFSHFYIEEPGTTAEQFAADLAASQAIASELGVCQTSIVLPRNQVRQDYLPTLQQSGIKVFRGNPKHPLYADGHKTPGGMAGRAVRFGDSWMNLTGTHTTTPELLDGLVNVPASMFLRPYTSKLSALESLRIRRIKTAMDAAAASNRVFHLWWHPHNFGLNMEKNLATLEVILQHYRHLRDTHGMRSMCMGEFACVEAV